MHKHTIVLMQPRCGKYDMYICDLPLSLIYVASVLASRSEYEIVIIDQRIDKNWTELIRRHAASGGVLFFGVTAMTGEPVAHALEMCAVARQHSAAPLVWGGIHPTIAPEQVLRHPLADYVIRGKGEYALAELAEALSGTREISNVSGLSYVDASSRGFVHNPEVEKFDWSAIPSTPYHLVDQNRYHRSGFPRPVVSVMTSRNCPHNCAFCYNSSLPRRQRWVAEPFERTFATLTSLYERYQPKYISFIDDDFFVDLNRSRTILEFIRDNLPGIEIGFRGARVDDLMRCDDAMFDLMRQVRVRHINIGVESGSPRILKILQKGITPDQAVALNRRFAQYPEITPLYNFFSGIPQETDEDIRLSVDLLLQLVEENPHCQISGYHQYVPYPGSALYETAKQNGFAPPAELADWGEVLLETNAAKSPWISPQRRRLLDMIYTMIYFADYKYESYFANASILHKMLLPWIKLYRPICRWRLRHLCASLPVEVWAKDLFYRIFT